MKKSSDLFTVDLTDLLDQEDDDYHHRQYHAKSRGLRSEIKAYGSYLNFREEYNLSHPQAQLAANFNMPVKKAYGRGGAATRARGGKAIRTTARPKQRATAGSSRASAIDLTKAAEAAAKKIMAKAIETQHSTVAISMIGYEPDLTKAPHFQTRTGREMGPLNRVGPSDAEYTSDNVFLFNLSALCQVKGTQTNSSSGWRNGYKVWAEKLIVDARIRQVNCDVDATYHMYLVKRKDNTAGGAWVPTIVGHDKIQLFHGNEQGPFATNRVEGTALTMQKKNTESWTFLQKCHAEKTMYAEAMFKGYHVGKEAHMGLFKDLSQSWEFTTATPTTEPTLKDGDIYIVMFREGLRELSGFVDIKINIDLSFKDA